MGLKGGWTLFNRASIDIAVAMATVANIDSGPPRLKEKMPKLNYINT
jgi:hypothetical protein